MSLRSTNTCGPLTTDLYRKAGGFPSLPLLVHGCARCGYSGYVGDFDPEQVTPELKEWVRTNLKPMPGRFPTGAKYANSARIAEYKGVPSFHVAQLWLKAGWCETEARTWLDVRYRREAVARFEAAMERNEVAADSRATTTYLIGELHRRVGDMDKAKAWFARVPDAVGGNAKQEWLIDLAIQQSTHPKEIPRRWSTRDAKRRAGCGDREKLGGHDKGFGRPAHGRESFIVSSHSVRAMLTPTWGRPLRLDHWMVLRYHGT
jgi:hypothetical protein